MSRTGRAVVALGAGLAMSFVACGNGAPTSSGTGSGGASVGTSGATLGTAAVKIKATDALAFDPKATTATVSQIVEWDNPGQTGHNITFTDSNDVALSDTTFNSGDTWQVKITTPGTYHYRCTIHSGMDGTLTVS